jgi:hypothetical protein
MVSTHGPESAVLSEGVRCFPYFPQSFQASAGILPEFDEDRFTMHPF